MESVRPFIYENVKAGSAVSTDEANIYKLLKSAGYDHKPVNHSKKEWTTFNSVASSTTPTASSRSGGCLETQSAARIFT